jgi:hypothetical protein
MRRKKSTGVWFCRIKAKEWNHRYGTSDKGRKAKLDYWHRRGRLKERDRLIKQLDQRIEDMLEQYPFLKEVGLGA